MAKSKLKKEWDKNSGKLVRKCRVCLKEFTVKHWRQTLCDNELCKELAFRKSHLEASKKRWEQSLAKAKAKGIEFN